MECAPCFSFVVGGKTETFLQYVCASPALEKIFLDDLQVEKTWETDYEKDNPLIEHQIIHLPIETPLSSGLSKSVS